MHIIAKIRINQGTKILTGIIGINEMIDIKIKNNNKKMCISFAFFIFDFFGPHLALFYVNFCI